MAEGMMAGTSRFTSSQVWGQAEASKAGTGHDLRQYHFQVSALHLQDPESKCILKFRVLKAPCLSHSGPQPYLLSSAHSGERGLLCLQSISKEGLDWFCLCCVQTPGSFTMSVRIRYYYQPNVYYMLTTMASKRKEVQVKFPEKGKEDLQDKREK